VYERLRTQADLDLTDRVQTLRMLGRALFATAAHDQAAQRLAEAAALAEACDAATVAEVLLTDAVASWFTLGPRHSLPLATRARELAGTAAGPVRRQASAAWGFVASLTGDPAGLVASHAAAQELMSGSLEVSELWWGLGPLGSFAIAALFAERFTEVERALERIMTAAEQAGSAEAMAAQLVTKALLAARRGRLAEALVAAEQASAWADLAPYCEAPAGFAHAEILLLMGRLTECAEWCQRMEAIAAARGQSYALLRLWHVRAQLLHHSGDLDGACGLYARIEQLTTRMGIAEPCAVPWARHALNAYLATTRVEDVHRVIGWLERGAKGLSCRYPRIAAATGRAWLADTDGDLTAAEAHFRTTLALHEQVQLPMEHIETLLAYGSFLRRHGDRKRARALLVQALAIADTHHAPWLGDQVREELRVAGGRRRRTCEEPTRLTAQEARVGRLAATGQSNKTIASQLNISVKTVEYHLGQVYTKLGISSRHQLTNTHYDDTHTLMPTLPNVQTASQRLGTPQGKRHRHRLS